MKFLMMCTVLYSIMNLLTCREIIETLWWAIEINVGSERQRVW
jgi:hypothetical protein